MVPGGVRVGGSGLLSDDGADQVGELFRPEQVGAQPLEGGTGGAGGDFGDDKLEALYNVSLGFGVTITF